MLTLLLILTVLSAALMVAGFMIPGAAAIVMCDHVADSVDGGSPGTFSVWTGTAPANCEAASTGTKLWECTLDNPAFGAAADIDPGARATAAGVPKTANAAASGTAGYGRMFNSAGVCKGQFTVGTSGTDAILSTTTFVSGAPASLTALTLTHPEV